MTAFRPAAIAILIAAGSTACSIDVQSSQRSIREEKRFTVNAVAQGYTGFDSDLTRLRLVEGRAPRGPNEIVIDASLAVRLSYVSA